MAIKKVIIFGATGMTGIPTVQSALSKGYEVTAFVRDSTKLPADVRPTHVVVGDVTNRADVDRAVEGQEAVIVVLGTRNDLSPTTVLSDGTRNIIAAMAAHNVQRIACCLSYHERMLEALRASDRQWVAVCPPHIEDSPARGNYTLKTDGPVGRIITKGDLAQVLVDAGALNAITRCSVTTVGGGHYFTHRRLQSFRYGCITRPAPIIKAPAVQKSCLPVPSRLMDAVVITLSIVVLTINSSSGHEVFAASAFRGFHRFFQVIQILTLNKQLQPWKVLSSVIYDQREQLSITNNLIENNMSSKKPSMFEMHFLIRNSYPFGVPQNVLGDSASVDYPKFKQWPNSDEVFRSVAQYDTDSHTLLCAFSADPRTGSAPIDTITSLTLPVVDALYRQAVHRKFVRKAYDGQVDDMCGPAHVVQGSPPVADGPSIMTVIADHIVHNTGAPIAGPLLAANQRKCDN
ncbi:unnamed protein product, partial [Medioppia subpectinata]